MDVDNDYQSELDFEPNFPRRLASTSTSSFNFDPAFHSTVRYRQSGSNNPSFLKPFVWESSECSASTASFLNGRNTNVTPTMTTPQQLRTPSVTTPRPRSGTSGGSRSTMFVHNDTSASILLPNPNCFVAVLEGRGTARGEVRMDLRVQYSIESIGNFIFLRLVLPRCL